MRGLCRGDEGRAAALPGHVGDLEPLLAGKGVAEALVDMLVALVVQDGAGPSQALAAFWRERPLPRGR